jgi:hypothetical protein
MERSDLCTYVREIRDHLWAGEAAVMVGAGFSRNANPRHEGVGEMKAWSALVKRMHERMSRGCDDSDGLRESEFRAGNFTEIAEQFEQLIGRAELRSAIQKSVPDDNYEPSPLHEMLMALPWTDVFTTNYDRLLERTRSRVPNRSYDVVRTASQLPKSSQPRIIKLHGDFNLPNEPLIITREDYREYPQKRIAFVNTVRQSLMENSFVLVGFSGDDPNFKKWIGWLRDVLAERRHKTYLCGLHANLSSGKRKVLQRDGIRPVDLSSAFTNDEDVTHESALRWLFCSLYAGQPPNGRNWPQPSGWPSRWGECSQYLSSDEEIREEPGEPSSQPPT